MALSRLLIANRGEIAVRIARTAKRLGFHVITVYSEADCDALHRTVADESHCIGGASAAASYLNAEAVLRVAAATRADSLHPGYGFLSESPSFASAVEAAGICFIGPSAETMRLLGDKASARSLAHSLGIPVPRGFEGHYGSLEELADRAREIGSPVLVKAAAGGGGRGMRLLSSLDDILPALAAAEAEAKRNFGNGRLLLEEALTQVRHIEVQVAGDSSGAVGCLFDRDCSIQRSYQKIIEESPAPDLPEKTRTNLFQSANRLAEAAGLQGLATVEFLVSKTDGERYWFLEVNPRLQVEHPVSELVLGLDLVELQLRLAGGEALLPLTDGTAPRGAAIEARLCAEEPQHDFTPSAGTIENVMLPEFVRVDHAVFPGLVVTTFYDSLLLKLIAHGATTAEARRKLLAALEETDLSGVHTNREYLIRCLRVLERERVADTRFCTSFASELLAPHSELLTSAAVAAALAAVIERQRAALPSPWRELAGAQFTFGFSSSFSAERLTAAISAELPLLCARRTLTVHEFLIDGECATVAFESGERIWTAEIHSAGDALSLAIENVALDARIAALEMDEAFSAARVIVAAHAFTIQLTKTELSPRPQGSSDETQDRRVRVVAAIPGTVLRLEVRPGATVKPGAVIAVIESMKMEHKITSPRGGRVEAVYVSVGGSIKSGECIAEVYVEP